MDVQQRYFVKLAYNGAAYHGWQMQENALSVQEALEKAMETILGQKVALTGAGRTDTGVHAREFYAHFELERQLSAEECSNAAYKLNSLLPADIFIFDIFPVGPDVHARFDAISRTYEYHIIRRKDPFRQGLAWYVWGKFDMESMNKAAAILHEYTDFTSFSKLHTQVKTNNCRIMHAAWEEEGHLLVFRITADRFLRNMVRAIVGTLIDIGRGRYDAEAIRKIIEAKDRSLAGLSVPAHGLFLSRVEYPDGRLDPPEQA